MGLPSFGLTGSYKKETTSQDENSSSTSTTTPIIEDWIRSPVQGATGQIQGLMGQNPYGFVAPAHELQGLAAAGAQNLSGSPWNFDASADLMRGVAQQGANTYSPYLGQSHGYDAATGEARGYDAASFSGATLGPTTQAQAGSVLDNLSAYYNPFQDQITNPVLADFDAQAGRTRAQQALDLAGSGAFGGSGAALAQSQTEGELARARASTLGGLLGDMFKTSTGLADSDASRRTQVSMANASAANQAGLSQAGFNQEAGLANAGALNQARQFGAGAQNDFTRANMDSTNQARQFGANAWNTQGLANQQASNEAGRYNAQAQDAALQRRMDAARGLTDLSAAYGANQRANIETQGQMGAMLRGVQNEQLQAPLMTTERLVAMLNGLPLAMFAGTQNQSNSTSHSQTKSKGFSIGGSVGSVK